MPGSSPGEETELSALCRQCGLCCEGSLFTFLPLSEEEAERVQALGARVRRRKDGRWALLLGCALLRGTTCGAYAQRPQRCREFVCQLGRALERGERSLPGAVAIVEETRRQLQALEALLPPGPKGEPDAVVQRAHRVEAREPGDATFEAVRQKLRALEAHLAHYFIGPY